MPKQSERAEADCVARAVCLSHTPLHDAHQEGGAQHCDGCGRPFCNENGKDGINEIPEAEKKYRPRAFNMY